MTTEEMLDDTLKFITKEMIKSKVEEKKFNKEEIITMKKVDFYNFCKKLVKLLKDVEEME